MKVSEIKKLLKEGKQIKDLSIEVKPYVSILKKQAMIEKIIEGCIDYNDAQLAFCNFINKQIAFDLSILLNYTNIKTGKNIISDYDFLQENGIFDYIYEKINIKDLNLIQTLLDNEIKQKLDLENSFEFFLIRISNTLINKLPDNKQVQEFLRTIIDNLGQFSWDKIPSLKKIVDLKSQQNIDSVE